MVRYALLVFILNSKNLELIWWFVVGGLNVLSAFALLAPVVGKMAAGKLKPVHAEHVFYMKSEETDK